MFISQHTWTEQSVLSGLLSLCDCVCCGVKLFDDFHLCSPWCLSPCDNERCETFVPIIQGGPIISLPSTKLIIGQRSPIIPGHKANYDHKVHIRQVAPPSGKTQTLKRDDSVSFIFPPSSRCLTPSLPAGGHLSSHSFLSYQNAKIKGDEQLSRRDGEE